MRFCTDNPKRFFKRTKTGVATAFQILKRPKWNITTPINFGNGQNESFNPRAKLETAKMTHYSAMQNWKRQK